MLDVLTVTGTIFIVIGVGYAAVTVGVFARSGLRVLGNYVVKFALPALIFKSVSARHIGDLLNAGYLGAYAFGTLTVLALGYAGSRFIARQTKIASTFAAMGMCCPNSGFVGYPILLMVVPAIATDALALSMLVENVILIPLLLTLAARASGTQRGWALLTETFRRLMSSPVVLAILAGIAVSISGITLPEVVTTPIGLIASSSAAVSLLVVGGTVAGLSLRAIGARTVTVVVGKIFLLPAAVWVGLALMAALGVGVGSNDMALAAAIIAATPAMSIYPILAQQYGQEDDAALALLLQTIVSFFTISGLLLL